MTLNVHKSVDAKLIRIELLELAGEWGETLIGQIDDEEQHPSRPGAQVAIYQDSPDSCYEVFQFGGRLFVYFSAVD